MFRKFDETVQSNKIAKLFYKAGFDNRDIEKVVSEVTRCNKIGIECNVANKILEIASYKLPIKEGYEVRKLLALNEQAPAPAAAAPAAPAQKQGVINKIGNFFGKAFQGIKKAVSPEAQASRAIQGMTQQVTALLTGLTKQATDYGNKSKYLAQLQAVQKALQAAAGETAAAEKQQAAAAATAGQQQQQPQQQQQQQPQPATTTTTSKINSGE
jgi:hypothetical protein